MRRRGPSPIERILRLLQRGLRPFEVAQIRRFGRSLLSVLFRTPVLLLHTRGRSTGRERTTPLAYHRGPDGSLLIVGGAAGQSRVPDWVANLRAGSIHAEVTLDRERLPIRVEELDEAERRERWAELRRRWPRIDSYRRRAGREIPVFRFRPVEPSDGDSGGGRSAGRERSAG